MVFKISCCLLALLVNISASPSFDSGLLSRLYKKAASENRPLILVLDGTSKDRDDNDDDSRDHKRGALDEDADRNRDVPSSLLDILNQKRQPSKSENKQALHDHSQDHRENRYKHNDLSRLKYRLEKELKDRRERRERKIRAKGQDRDDIIHYRGQGKAQESRNQNRNRYRHQDRHLDRNQDRNQDRTQDRHLDRKQDRNEDSSKIKDSKALRSSVIRNLLRTYNDLNCEAKDECEDECNYRNNKNDCEVECEEKFVCDEEVKKEDDPCIVNDKDECASDVDEVRSTRGERLVTVTEKCKRC